MYWLLSICVHISTIRVQCTYCRHFADNWVVAWGPGFISDLALEWESFKAARGALGGVITAARAKDMSATYAAALPELQAQLASFLVEGKLKVCHCLCMPIRSLVPITERDSSDGRPPLGRGRFLLVLGSLC